MNDTIKLTIAFALATAGFSAQSQTVLTGGFGTDGMGVVNGAAYTKTATLGSGGFPFVSAAKDGGAFYTAASGKLYFINGDGSAFTDSANINLRRISSSNEATTLFGNTATSLCRVNTSTKSVIDSIILGAPWELTERPNASEVWVSDSGKMHVVDYSSGLSSSTMPFTSSPYDYGAVKFSPGGSVGYKCASASKKMYKFNPATKTIIDSINTAPNGFSNLVVSHDSSKLFVCNTANNNILIYTASGLSLVDSMSCGTRVPMNIYRHPYRPEIWVVHHFSDSISVFDENTKALIAAFHISGSPWYIAFGSQGSSGVPTYAFKPSITLYPNPAQDHVTISGLDAGCKISLLNTVGRELRSCVSSGSTQTISVSDLPPGSYILRVTDNSNSVIGNVAFTKN